MPSWNFADIFESVADRVPNALATVDVNDSSLTWEAFERRSEAVGRYILECGCGPQAKVAAYLRNSSAYLEVYFAAFKFGFVPFNTNYRYGASEIEYLFDNADAEVVVYHREFSPIVEAVRERLPNVRVWIVVDDDSDTTSTDVRYDDVVSRPVLGREGLSRRSGDDLLLLYTGGTTGLPKGVMWRQRDLFAVLAGAGNESVGIPSGATDIAELLATLDGAGPVCLPACPMMHGTGLFSQFIAFLAGGSSVILPGRSFDAGDFLQLVERYNVNIGVIVGDAFAVPILDALDEAGGAMNLTSLHLLISSGVMWSQEVKRRLLDQLPNVQLFDSYGSSEAVGLGSSLTSSDNMNEIRTAGFTMGASSRLFDETGNIVEPSAGAVGRIGIGEPIPLGYYGDPAKTAQTFIEHEGKRYAVPGDIVQVGRNGELTLLGRGSSCINSGGEKVFPEEVEEVLKRHPSIQDAACIGSPDERFGEIVVAVVVPTGGAMPDQQELAGFVKQHLADFKAPRLVVTVDSLGRSPAGKLDHRALQALVNRSRTSSSSESGGCDR